jgi:hypothetical protein
LTAPVHPLQSTIRKDGELESAAPSLARRVFRSLSRFSIAVLIGVVVTLGWQTYRDVAKEMDHGQGSNACLVAIHFDDEVASRGCTVP